MRLPIDTQTGESPDTDLTESNPPGAGLSLLLTVLEVAESLGVSRSTVYELLYARRFPSVKIGNSRRVRRSDLEAFVRDMADVS